MWSVGGEAIVRLSGSGYRFMDMYGNAVSEDTASIRLSPAPLYFEGVSAPELQISSDVPAPEWHSLPPVSTWTCERASTCTQTGRGRRVQSPPSKYAYQLISPPIPVEAGSCYKARLQVSLEKGAAGVFAVDAATGTLIDHVAYSSYVPDGKPYMTEFRFHIGPSTSNIKLIAANGNLRDVQSIFTVFDAQLAPCR
jgi:hypothetical protein